jgi:hypothetical protein
VEGYCAILVRCYRHASGCSEANQKRGLAGKAGSVSNQRSNQTTTLYAI